ncbi:MAG: hypothetical protein A4E38_01836 [Methanoregulaceae archaeon PtaB.Bin108]|nr:MAG: hypothetical protein A4E38_01836 [Methanoregulaceae archaeon PtaB.Bin108]
MQPPLIPTSSGGDGSRSTSTRSGQAGSHPPTPSMNGQSGRPLRLPGGWNLTGSRSLSQGIRVTAPTSCTGSSFRTMQKAGTWYSSASLSSPRSSPILTAPSILPCTMQPGSGSSTAPYRGRGTGHPNGRTGGPASCRSRMRSGLSPARPSSPSHGSSPSKVPFPYLPHGTGRREPVLPPLISPGR